MNNAKLYNKANPLQKRDAQQIINEFSHLLERKSEEIDLNLLDVGCGSGDVLVEILLPALKNNFTEVVGVDISKEMIKYASEKYRYKFLKFLKADIESDFLSTKALKQNAPKPGQLQPESFNFITSFFCLHWIQNQRQAISNIFKLLKPNGTCLLTFLVSNPIFDIYLELSRMKKYAQYMGDVERFVSPYHKSLKPLEAFSEKLYDVGFKIFHIEIRDQIFIFDNVELLKYAVRAVNPFTVRMPEKLQDEFLDDYVRMVDDLHLIQHNEETSTDTVISPYKLMVVVANK